MRARVVNIHHGSRYDVYIGRPGRGMPGPLGNPIAVGKPCVVCGESHGRDDALLSCYKQWLWRKLRSDETYARHVRWCHGQVLGCFCVGKDGAGVCHGHVLADAAEWLAGGGFEQLWPAESPAAQVGPGLS